jgi:hypothetical protein
MITRKSRRRRKFTVIYIGSGGDVSGIDRKGWRWYTMTALNFGPHEHNVPCKDCGRNTTPTERGKPLFNEWDTYIVRDKVWRKAGMKGWQGGYLCTRCLRKRLGRRLTDADYLLRKVGATDDGLQVKSHPDYSKHHSVKRDK